MLSIPLAENLVTPYLHDDLWLSVINGHSNCVVSGSPAAIEQLEQNLKTDGVDALRLHTAGAFHSGLMDEVVPQLVEAASQLNISPPGIPYLSNVTGTWIEASQLLRPEYWGQHLRNTVRFAQGADELLAKFEHGIFLEVGPGNNLGSMVRRCAADNKTRAEVLPSLRHPRESITDGETVARALAGLWLQGVDIDWQEYDQHSRRCRVELPTYPFQRQSYWVKPAANSATSTLSTTRQSQQDWFYAPAWRSSPMIADDMRSELPGDLQGTWIVFANASFSSSRIISYLRQRGGQVYCVTAGNDFRNASPSNYTINPASMADYELLFADDQLASDRITGVIHCWGLDADQGSDSSVATTTLQLGYYSLLYTVQALIKSATNLSLHVNVLTQFSQAVDQDDSIVPEKSMVTSLLRVISQENIGFSYTLHDLLDEDIEFRSKQQSNPDDLPVELYSMLRSSPDTDRNSVLAYRRRRRWLQVYDHLSLKQTLPAETPVHLRERGVFLINGGLGRLGSVLYKYIAVELKARLVLTTRMALPERPQWDGYLRDNDSSDKLSRIISQVQYLESVGAEVLLASVDVSDREGMRELVDHAIAEFGEINGVIYAAGIVSGSSLASLPALTYEDCELQFTPKVYGLMVLKQLFGNYPLDFVMPVSSLSTVLGGLGFAAYSAANQFMDSLCQQQHNLGNSHWISANWDGWLFDQAGDKARDKATSPTNKVKSAGATFSMSAEEGSHVFEKILNSPFVPQMIISTGDLNARLQQWVFSGPGEPAEEVSDGNRYQRPPIKTPFVEPSTEIEKSLCNIWQEMLGIEAAGVDDDFFELGGHSLLATQLIARLRTELALELSLENLFEAPTVRQLAALVDSRQSAAEPFEEVTRLARQIKQLTPEQQQQMLAQARGGKA
jgi:malonyl CoA-acyl carrier protein transacylase/acyl carrier protein